LTNGDASSNNVARMFPGKDQDHTTEDHEFDTDKQEDSFANNQYSEFHDILELFFSCFFDRYNPFFKINMKVKHLFFLCLVFLNHWFNCRL
jgi:hypothetical protein